MVRLHFLNLTFLGRSRCLKQRCRRIQRSGIHTMVYHRPSDIVSLPLPRPYLRSPPSMFHHYRPSHRTAPHRTRGTCMLFRRVAVGMQGLFLAPLRNGRLGCLPRFLHLQTPGTTPGTELTVTSKRARSKRNWSVHCRCPRWMLRQPRSGKTRSSPVHCRHHCRLRPLHIIPRLLR